MIALLVMTDGRKDCIVRTITSASEQLAGPLSRLVIHDDSGDPHYQHWLGETFPDFEIIRTPGRSGFGGAIANAWDYLARTAEDDDCRYLFATEDDFVFERRVELTAMMHVLDENPHLVQLVLKRQPWNDEERAAGGIIEQHPADYEDRYDGRENWIVHRRFFSTNPYLTRRSLTWEHWPDGEQSEGRFTHQLLAADPAARFAFWGARTDEPWVTHIGTERMGCGY